MEDQETATTSSKDTTVKINFESRLGKCEVCAAQEAHYTCPKCEVKTCCLRCVQIHKKELACNGIRDRTQFIHLRKMTKMDFMSDYYFLEECTRFASNRKFDRVKQFTRYNKLLPTRLFRLRNAAAERGITLHFLLDNFTRHKENTTYFDWNKHQILWRVEWIFANAGGLKYVDERCADDEPLHALLDKYVNPKSSAAVPLRKELEYYQSVGAFALKVMLKAEGVYRSRSRFYSLDVTQTLKANLAGKTLVEFPCIFVSYAANADTFDIIDSDEDIESETKAYRRNLHDLRKDHRIDMLKKEVKPNGGSDDGDDDAAQIQAQKLQEHPDNYLFTDERLWDQCSSEDETAEEDNNTGLTT